MSHSLAWDFGGSSISATLSVCRRDPIPAGTESVAELCLLRDDVSLWFLRSQCHCSKMISAYAATYAVRHWIGRSKFCRSSVVQKRVVSLEDLLADLAGEEAAKAIRRQPRIRRVGSNESASVEEHSLLPI